MSSGPWILTWKCLKFVSSGVAYIPTTKDERGLLTWIGSESFRFLKRLLDREEENRITFLILGVIMMKVNSESTKVGMFKFI